MTLLTASALLPNAYNININLSSDPRSNLGVSLFNLLIIGTLLLFTDAEIFEDGGEQVGSADASCQH